MFPRVVHITYDTHYNDIIDFFNSHNYKIAGIIYEDANEPYQNASYEVRVLEWNNDGITVRYVSLSRV